MQKRKPHAGTWGGTSGVKKSRLHHSAPADAVSAVKKRFRESKLTPPRGVKVMKIKFHANRVNQASWHLYKASVLAEEGNIEEALTLGEDAFFMLRGLGQ